MQAEGTRPSDLETHIATRYSPPDYPPLQSDQSGIVFRLRQETPGFSMKANCALQLFVCQDTTAYLPHEFPLIQSRQPTLDRLHLLSDFYTVRRIRLML